MTTKSKEDVVTTMIKEDTIQSQIDQINHPIQKKKQYNSQSLTIIPQCVKSHNYSLCHQ